MRKNEKKSIILNEDKIEKGYYDNITFINVFVDSIASRFYDGNGKRFYDVWNVLLVDLFM